METWNRISSKSRKFILEAVVEVGGSHYRTRDGVGATDLTAVLHPPHPDGV